MEFKNIGQVSESNFRHYKAAFMLLVDRGQINQAKREYELIFTPEEMDYLIKRTYKKS